MSAYNKFNQFVEDLAKKVKHNLNSDTLKVMFSNVAPVATNSIKSNLTDISAGNGYTAGGTQAAFVSGAQTSGTYKLVLSNVVFTASGAVGPFRYAALYNDTQASPVKPLIAWWDYGSSISLANGDTFTVAYDATNGVLTIA
jgi:hypothetical protein